MVEGFSTLLLAAEKLVRCVAQSRAWFAVHVHTRLFFLLSTVDRGGAGAGVQNVRLVCDAAGVHPVPSRTRQLSPPAPMVLGWTRPGRLGPRQALLFLPLPPCRCWFLPPVIHSQQSLLLRGCQPAMFRVNSAPLKSVLISECSMRCLSNATGF